MKGEKMSKVLSKDQIKSFVEAYGIKTVEDAHSAVKDLLGGALQQALEAELTASLGHNKYERQDASDKNYRNGTYKKTVNSTFGHIDLDVPRDRNGDYTPVIVKKGQTDISALESRIISMYAKGLSTRDIHDHMREIYGVEMSAEMISKITDKIVPQIREWQQRPLDRVYPIVYMDAIHFNVRDNGQTVKKAIYIALAIDCDGMKDILGVWVGGNESAKYWLSVLTELKNRGVHNILIACVDGLSGFKEAIEAVFPTTEIQRCIVHHIRYCCKFVNYKDRKEFCADMKNIYGAPTEVIALEYLEKFDKKWGKNYKYAVKSWEDNWSELSTFFKYPKEIRRLIYTTNPIESLNSSIRKTVGQKRTFPTDEAVLKSVFLAVQGCIKKWSTRTRDWHAIFNQLTLHFEDKLKEVKNLT